MTESQALNFNFINGTYTLNDASSVYGSLNYTGFAGTITNTGRTIFGNYTLSAGMTITAGNSSTTFGATSGAQQITTNGQTLDFPITQNGVGGTVQLQDNLTMGSTRTFTLTNGTLDLSSGNRTLSCGVFSSTNTNTRSILFGSGNITLTGNNATVWTNANATNFSYTGTPTVNATYSGSTGTRTINSGTTAGTESNALSFNISAGTDIVTLTTNDVIKNLSFTGFAGTLSNNTRTIYGNLTFSSGMTCTAGTLVTTFAATSGTQQITTNGVTLDFPIAQNGVGGTVQLQDNLTMGSTRALTITNGTFDTNGQTISGPTAVTLATGTIGLKNTFSIPITQSSGDVTLFANTSTTTYTLTAGTLNLNGFNLTASTQFSTSNSNVRSINFASFGKVILSGSGTVWDATTATNLTTSGSGMISLTSTSAKTFAGGGASYRTISQDGVGTLTLTGANTFVNIDNTVQPTTVTFPAGVTTSVNNFALSGTPGNLVTINSSTPGTQFTLAQV
jgi:fibronectin-binding autotransporter adhesin